LPPTVCHAVSLVRTLTLARPAPPTTDALPTSGIGKEEGERERETRWHAGLDALVVLAGEAALTTADLNIYIYIYIVYLWTTAFLFFVGDTKRRKEGVRKAETETRS
jgi:hypothetical protein